MRAWQDSLSPDSVMKRNQHAQDAEKGEENAQATDQKTNLFSNR